MKQWVLSKIVMDNDPDIGNFYRMALQRYSDLPFEFGEISVDSNTGVPVLTYGLALIGSDQVSRIADDPEIDVLPVDYDAQVVDGILDKYGLTSAAITMHDVIQDIGVTINPSFDVDNYSLAE
jgi:hypothetical protein